MDALAGAIGSFDVPTADGASRGAELMRDQGEVDLLDDIASALMVVSVSDVDRVRRGHGAAPSRVCVPVVLICTIRSTPPSH